MRSFNRSLLLFLLMVIGFPGVMLGKPRLVMLIAEKEYKTWETLPVYAERFLAKDFEVAVVSGSTEGGATAFEGIDAVKDADVLLISVWRRTPPAAQMELIRRHIEAGKPVVGLRTASHAFVLRRGEPREGELAWPDWDAQIFGGSYGGHHGAGIVTQIVAPNPGHPILKNVRVPFTSHAKLYRTTPLKENAQALLVGSIPGQPEQAVAYTATHVGGGRAFYTSLGDPTDFENDSFLQLLRNGILWAAGRLEAGAGAP